MMCESPMISNCPKADLGDDVLLRTAAGREFVLAEADEFDIEVELVRQNEELMNFLAERSRDTKTVALAEARQKMT